MNPIRNIEIKNFKSIRHQKIDGCKRINVFIGYPNVGKSNILEAISLFGANIEVDIKDLVRVKEIPTIFFNGLIEDDLMIVLNDECGIFGNFSENAFSLQFQTKEENREFQKIRLNPVLNQAITKSYNYRDFSSRTGIQGTWQISKQFAAKKYEFRKGISSNVGSYSSLQYPFGNNIFSVLQTNKILKADAKELFDEYKLELLYDSREQEYTIMKRIESGIFTVPYELVADTLQRLIFYKAAILSNEENVLVFEEPEAHMFPPYMRKFTTDVIFSKKNQFFIATHSPYVLESFMADAQDDLAIYLVSYENGETKVKLMEEEDIQEVREYGVDLFYNLESYLKHGQVNND